MITTLTGAPRWIDLMTTDMAKARAFYGALLGWTFTDTGPEFGHYTTAASEGAGVAGLMAKTPEMGPMPDVWSVYLGVDDARASVTNARERGADVMVDAMDVGDLGVMAVVADPGRAAVGLWQPGTHPGFEAVARPGAPAWFEVMNRDYDDAIGFYQDVFGWRTATMCDTEDFRYTTLGEGDDAVAGICDAAKILPEEIPSHWRVYFAVEDTDAAVARVRELGGSVVADPEDSEFGRMATVSDDQGAVFLLAGPTRAA